MHRVLLSAALLLLASACSPGYSDEAPPAETLQVRRGDFRNDVVISGELEAARGELLSVPPLPSWQTAVKWIAEDGAAVKAGDPVAELDNTALTSDLDSKRQMAMQASQELQQKESEWSADLEQKELEVETRKSQLDKAILDAGVPRDLVSLRKYEESQNALRRATGEHEKAIESLRARRSSVAAERENLLLNIRKTERDITIAETAIDALVLRAPKDGIVVIRDHQWEGRKLQVGDPVWVGFPIALLPDLSTLRVNAALADVDDGKIAPGMPVTVTLDGYPDQTFTGRIAAISAVAQESRRQSLRRHFEVLVSLDRLDPARMRPGLSARVVVRQASRSGVLLAPRAALDLAGTAPRIRLEDGEMKNVKVDACNAQECVISGEIREGTRLAPIVEVNRG